MSQRAHVTSVEALEAFRSRLIVYMTQARSALEEVSADVVRTRVWLENDQRLYWEKELRRRSRELDEAQQALFSARISNLKQESSMEELMVHRAKRLLDEGVARHRVVKQWNREFEGRVQPMVKQMEKLHTILSNDLVLATTYLTQAMGTLAAYAQVAPPTGLAESTASPRSGPGGGAGESQRAATPDPSAPQKRGTP